MRLNFIDFANDPSQQGVSKFSLYFLPGRYFNFPLFPSVSTASLHFTVILGSFNMNYATFRIIEISKHIFSKKEL